MQKYIHLCLLFTLLAALNSCDYFNNKHKAGIVAEVNGQYLYESDLPTNISSISGTESTDIMKQYIKQWVMDKLVYEEATGRVNKDIERLVEDYRQSLYVHEYERRLVKKQMPKLVSDSLVTDFYTTHSDHFLSQEGLVKGGLLILPNSAPNIEQLKKWIQKPNEDNVENIEKYAYKYALGYELFTEEWRTSNQLLLRIPIEKNSLYQQLKNKQLIEMKDSLSTYLLWVENKCLPGDMLPIEYVRPRIEQIILKERQIAFLKSIREELYNDAIRFKKVKFYDNE